MSFVLSREQARSVVPRVGPSKPPRRPARAAGWLGAARDYLAQRLAHIVRESQCREAARELHRLDDRTLYDIGISRSEITAIVRSGVEGDPTRLPRVRDLYRHGG